MAVTISSLISTCPAPISDATGVSNAIGWLALANDFALAQDNKNLYNRHSIINYSLIYMNNINIGDTNYADINDKLMHIKYFLTAQQTMDS